MFEKLKSGVNSLVQKISQKELSDQDISKILDEFLLALVENNVAYSVAKQICDNLHEKLRATQFRRFTDSTEPAKEVLREVLLELLKGSGEESFYKVLNESKNAHKPAIILFVGVNGTGKTSSIAKVGHLLLRRVSPLSWLPQTLTGRVL